MRAPRLLLAFLTGLALTLALSAASARAANLQLFDVPTNDANLRGLTLGGDGALWFTERAGARIGRITTAGAISEYPITPGTSLDDTGPDAIVTATDGAVWFSSDLGYTVFRVTPSATPTIQRLYDDSFAPVDGLGPAAGGGVWATFSHGDENDADGDGLLRIGPGGAAQTFAASYLWLHPLALAPDGAAWFGDGEGSDTILKRVDDSGHISNTPFSSPGSHQISAIAFGADGSPWFTEFYPGTGFAVPPSGGAIGHLVNGQAQVTQLPGPNARGNPLPDSLVRGPDGAFWWAETKGIGRLDPATGQISEAALDPYDPTAIAFDASGGLWFIDSSANKIGRIAIDGSLFPPAPGTAQPPTGTPAPPVVRAAPQATLTLPHLTIKSVRTRKAIALTCALKAAGTCTVKASLPRATAKKLKLKVGKKAKTLTIGSTHKTLKKAGKAKLTLELSSATLRGLARAKSAVKVTLATTSSATGTTPHTSTRTLTLRR